MKTSVFPGQPLIPGKCRETFENRLWEIKFTQNEIRQFTKGMNTQNFYIISFVIKICQVCWVELGVMTSDWGVLFKQFFKH